MFNFLCDIDAICCSSPERYLRIDGTTRIMDSKPIKGTARRLLHKSVEEDVAVAVALAKDVKTMYTLVPQYNSYIQISYTIIILKIIYSI